MKPMEHTKMYIELIIIGFQTISWIILCVASSIGIKIHELLSKYYFDNAIVITISLITCYVVGIIADRIYAWIVDIIKFEKNMKKQYNIKSKRTLFIWHARDEMEYYNFTMSRKRILRASVFNFSLGFIFLIVYIVRFKLYSNSILWAFAVLLIIFGFGAYKVYELLIKNYYEKAKDFEVF